MKQENNIHNKRMKTHFLPLLYLLLDFPFLIYSFLFYFLEPANSQLLSFQYIPSKFALE